MDIGKPIRRHEVVPAITPSERPEPQPVAPRREPMPTPNREREREPA
jgi:hypothetical protein